MKSGRSLTELAQEITRRAEAKRDFIVPSNKMLMTADTRLEFGDISVKPNDLAHAQIASAVDIPKKYYDRMRAEAPELLSNNVNLWFKKNPVNRMVRCLDDTNRALLSEKFRPLENEDLAQATLPILMEKELDIMSCEITDRRLYIKAVDKSLNRELMKHGGELHDGKHVIVHDVLYPAITISNSEVGEGAVSILAGVYKGGCSNLATFGERSMRKYHVGSKHELGNENIYAMLSDETRRITDAAIWAQVRDVVKNAFERAAFESLVDTIEETRKQPIEDVVRVVELSSKRFGFNEAEGKNVLKHLIEGGDLSRFGLFNAVTRASQDVEDYDRATELERVGGQIVELKRTEWSELAMAA